MSVAPTTTYLTSFKEQPGQVTQASKLFPGSVETVTISDATSADYTKTVASQSAFETRPYTLVKVAVTSAHFTVDAVLTIDKNYKQPGDKVEFRWTQADIAVGRTLYIKSDASTPVTLATITSVTDANTTVGSRTFVLNTDGTWIDISRTPLASTGALTVGALTAGATTTTTLAASGAVTAATTLGVTGASTLAAVSATTITATSLAATGAITSNSPSAGIGYTTGAGAAGTQTGSRTTTVVVTGMCGSITLVSAAGSATPASFTVTNTSVAATDVIRICQKSGTDKYFIAVTAVGTGSFQVTSYTTGGTTTEQPVFNFSVLKCVAS